MDETGVEIPGFGGKKAELQAMYDRAKELVAQRNAHEAAKQAATNELQKILENGRIKHTLLRQHLKVQLGDDNEMLTAYGIRPNRGRPRRRKTSAPEE
jgi:hypothetical protein